MIRLSLSVAMALGVAVPAAAQDIPQAVTLQDAITMAQTQSLAARSAERARDAARWQYRDFRARLLPQVKMTAGAPRFFHRIEQVTQPDGTVRFIGRSQTESSVMVSVDQPLTFTGGQLYFTSSLLRNAGNDNRFWSSSPAVFGIRQDLFRPNTFAWDSHEQALTSEAAERQYVEQREDLAGQTVDAFFGALRAQAQLQSAHTNAAINDTLYRFNQARYEAGKIAEGDLLQSELALLRAKAAVEDARLASDRAMATLRLDLGVDRKADVNVVAPAALPVTKVDADLAARSAASNTSAALRRTLQLVQAKRSVREAKANAGFGATVNAEVGYNQTATDFNDAYHSLLGQQQVSVEVQVPLIQWGAGKARVASARAAQEGAEHNAALDEQRQAQEAYYVASNLDRLRRQADLAAKADTVAAQRFEITTQRYLLGKDDGTTLFTAQNDKDAARQAYVDALGAYWAAYYQLRRLTLYDFAANGAIVAPERATTK